ncbi:hypothetical protein [Subdoligranulum variabile]|uniref:Uncharacterized protein n=1 Tax=Subdoligranulum variabile DSM 15176 TaxID=411471 RepID=D1PNU7_9FIRM|nr:hypothetical protein [Subdoligranulum variabile]EFB76232.1 hypothetical protein SUBVAR_06018 [Subdoligranulum variabile DSM 15176]UWP68863.1 hypothetical protein NQ490_03140 [Subdoligranulum variabile]
MENKLMQCIILSAMAILLSMIAIFFSFVRFCFTEQAQWQKKFLKRICSLRYEIFHGAIVGALTIYVFVNWNKCVSMQFFQKFDGNNILFLVWIILIFLLIYEVEGKGIKVAQRKHEQTQQSLDEAKWKYQLDTMLEQVKKQESNANDFHREAKGGQ